jgi:hypothetical protein
MRVTRIQGVVMSDQVRAISGVGGVTSKSIVDWFYQSFSREQAQIAPVERGGRVRDGAPADVVELSMEPETLRELPANMYLKFLVDKADGRVVIQVIDAATDEVVRVVPPSKLRDTLREL